MVVLLGTIVVIAALILAYIAGMLSGAKVEARRELAKLGFNRQSAVLYKRAAKILNRMVNVTELDGDFAADILSEPTKKLVAEWVDDYNKEINKV